MDSFPYPFSALSFNSNHLHKVGPPTVEVITIEFYPPISAVKKPQLQGAITNNNDRSGEADQMPRCFEYVCHWSLYGALIGLSHALAEAQYLGDLFWRIISSQDLDYPWLGWDPHF